MEGHLAAVVVNQAGDLHVQEWCGSSSHASHSVPSRVRTLGATGSGAPTIWRPYSPTISSSTALPRLKCGLTTNRYKSNGASLDGETFFGGSGCPRFPRTAVVNGPWLPLALSCGLRSCGRLASNGRRTATRRLFGPSFDDEHRSLMGLQVEYISHAHVGEIDVVENVGKFPDKLYAHTLINNVPVG